MSLADVKYDERGIEKKILDLASVKGFIGCRDLPPDQRSDITKNLLNELEEFFENPKKCKDCLDVHKYDTHRSDYVLKRIRKSTWQTYIRHVDLKDPENHNSVGIDIKRLSGQIIMKKDLYLEDYLVARYALSLYDPKKKQGELGLAYFALSKCGKGNVREGFTIGFKPKPQAIWAPQKSINTDGLNLLIDISELAETEEGWDAAGFLAREIKAHKYFRDMADPYEALESYITEFGNGCSQKIFDNKNMIINIITELEISEKRKHKNIMDPIYKKAN